MTQRRSKKFSEEEIKSRLMSTAVKVETLLEHLVHDYTKGHVDKADMTEEQFYKYVSMGFIIPGTLRWLAGEESPPVERNGEDKTVSPTQFVNEIITAALTYAHLRDAELMMQMTEDLADAFRRQRAGAAGMN